MGANLSRSFETAAEADRWAAQQAQLAAQWNLQVALDLGNTPIMRVPILKRDGTPGELAVPLEPARTVDKRVADVLARGGHHREDRRRRRTPGVIRSIRFE